ncbi:MAG: hypothetical protein ETSY1_21475 [Candidatus Entotheonella factor]|uniref:Right handed beta helix domain-containing protein n=1 Tax=Entotheonella factor TaxID=1429438 RepID=W4LK64_ENTF1|nr:MAG: hypothetical protein ETSY1_21475 [Candidatus Entotheonella factor]
MLEWSTGYGIAISDGSKGRFGIIEKNHLDECVRKSIDGHAGVQIIVNQNMITNHGNIGIEFIPNSKKGLVSDSVITNNIISNKPGVRDTFAIRDACAEIDDLKLPGTGIRTLIESNQISMFWNEYTRRCGGIYIESRENYDLLDARILKNTISIERVDKKTGVYQGFKPSALGINRVGSYLHSCRVTDNTITFSPDVNLNPKQFYWLDARGIIYFLCKHNNIIVTDTKYKFADILVSIDWPQIKTGDVNDNKVIIGFQALPSPIS